MNLSSDVSVHEIDMNEGNWRKVHGKVKLLQKTGGSFFPRMGAVEVS